MDGQLQRIARALGRLNARLARAGHVAAAALLATMLALALAQIVSRGLFGYSLDWAEELARVALVWSVLLVAPHAYRSGANVAIVTFADALPRGLRVALGLVLNALVVWILAVLLSESFAFWRRGLDLTAATIDLKMAWIYAVVPAAFGALILVGVELLVRLVLELRGARSGLAMEGAMPAVTED